MKKKYMCIVGCWDLYNVEESPLFNNFDDEDEEQIKIGKDFIKNLTDEKFKEISYPDSMYTLEEFIEIFNNTEINGIVFTPLTDIIRCLDVEDDYSPESDSSKSEFIL